MNPMTKSKYPRRRKSMASFVVALCLMVVGSMLIFFSYNNKPKTKTDNTNKTVARISSPSKVVGNYLFSGTIVLARDVARYANGNYNQPFSGMATLGSYDAHVGILECPITNNYDSFANEVQNLQFNCQPAWVPYLKKYFQVLNLSSDHLNDYGPQGIAETFQTLKAAGIQTVGTYNPATLSDNCKAIILPVRLIYASGKTTHSSLPVAMCSYNYKELFSPTTKELASISKWSKMMPTIALLNEGPEYEHTASPQTVAVAHEMINLGADFVVGNGTHWVQNTEVYKGKLIVYSMGNFIFDQINYYGRIALNLSVGVTIPYSKNVASWIDLSGKCLSSPENCLNLAYADRLKKIPISYKFNAVGSYGGDGLVATKANTQQENSILQIANWQQTERMLSK